MEKREGLRTLLHRNLSATLIHKHSALSLCISSPPQISRPFLSKYTTYLFSYPFYFSHFEILRQDLFSFSFSEPFKIKLQTPQYSKPLVYKGGCVEHADILRQDHHTVPTSKEVSLAMPRLVSSCFQSVSSAAFIPSLQHLGKVES